MGVPMRPTPIQPIFGAFFDIPKLPLNPPRRLRAVPRV
jgi:hypothetical protein